ncbi:MAG: hypothetical protein ACOC6H_02885 [Thermoproteota archaeon]
MSEDLYPYVVFLPGEQKNKVLSAIFGSQAAVDILKFSLKKGIGDKIYQKTVIQELSYSNKTVIKNFKSLTQLGVLTEDMEKEETRGRTVWVKTYHLSDLGKWFALLLAEEEDLTDEEQAEILRSIFRQYVKWLKDYSDRLQLDKQKLKDIFIEEMKTKKSGEVA